MRRTKRFPLEWTLFYRVLGSNSDSVVWGTGRTIDISSTGVLFTTDHELSMGQSIELSITWPILRYQSVPMTLNVVGEVVRIERGRAAVHVARRGFCTGPPPRLPADVYETLAWVM